MSASVLSVNASSLSRNKSSNVEVSFPGRLKPFIMAALLRELPEPPTSYFASMGRTRPKNRKARPPIDDPADGEKRSEPTIEALLEKAQELIVQCDYDLAGRFIDRVLNRAPDNAEAKEMLGVVQLETGLFDAAKQVCLHATSMCVWRPNASR
jgi:hypothetical protein